MPRPHVVATARTERMIAEATELKIAVRIAFYSHLARCMSLRCDVAPSPAPASEALGLAYRPVPSAKAATRQIMTTQGPHKRCHHMKGGLASAARPSTSTCAPRINCAPRAERALAPMHLACPDSPRLTGTLPADGHHGPAPSDRAERRPPTLWAVLPRCAEQHGPGSSVPRCAPRMRRNSGTCSQDAPPLLHRGSQPAGRSVNGRRAHGLGRRSAARRQEWIIRGVPQRIVAAELRRANPSSTPYTPCSGLPVRPSVAPSAAPGLVVPGHCRWGHP